MSFFRHCNSTVIQRDVDFDGAIRKALWLVIFIRGTWTRTDLPTLLSRVQENLRNRG